MGKAKRSRERSILKGALAGLVGGIAGSGAKVLAERIYPPRAEERRASPMESSQQLEIAGEALGFGSSGRSSLWCGDRD